VSVSQQADGHMIQLLESEHVQASSSELEFLRMRESAGQQFK